MSTDDHGNGADPIDRLRFRPGQPVQKNPDGTEMGQPAGPGSPTAAASNSGGSGYHVAKDKKGPNPVADGTERADAAADGAETDDSPKAAPATS
jgi:hypothetical protein